MRPRDRFLLGAAGALSPSLLNVLVVDAANVLAALTPIVLIFYLVRVSALALVGGLWASFHRSEVDALRVFQLGIVAPALILATVNGSAVPKTALLPTALAAPPSACVRAGVPEMAPPAPTAYEQARQGLTGRPSTRTFFVVVGHHKTLEEARGQVLAMAGAGIAGRVFCAPERRAAVTPFAVVAGAWLERAEAEALLRRMVYAGFLRASLYDAANP